MAKRAFPLALSRTWAILGAFMDCKAVSAFASSGVLAAHISGSGRQWATSDTLTSGSATERRRICRAAAALGGALGVKHICLIAVFGVAFG